MSELDLGQQQAQRYLAILEKMDPESAQVFRKIYELAPKAGQARSTLSMGHHVRVAMIEALTHPSIAYWVKTNLAIRVSRKIAQTTGDLAKVQKLDRFLEDFHIAAEAFVGQISIEQVIQQRAEKNRPGKIVAFPLKTALSGNMISDAEIAQIQAFKQNLIPGFIQAIRNRASLESRRGVRYTQVQ